MILENSLFNLNVQYRCNEIFNFEIEVQNVLETKGYELTDEEKVPILKNLPGFQVIKAFMNEEKKMQDCKGTLSST